MSELGSRRAASSEQIAQSSAGRVVDGLFLGRVATPSSFDEVADLLRSASDRGEVVVPWGGGSMMGFGNLPERIDVALDTMRLDQVVSYHPDDLTISVQAGCRVSDLTSLLAEQGQMLPFDAADPEHATVGGLYATGVSGPRRFGYGAMRDLVIGITAISPRGEIARGGGMVVKNVSGYDMMRLHYGALGSLGVVLQLNFKVLPMPRASRTVVLGFSDLDGAIDAAMRVRQSPLAPSSIVVLDEQAADRVGLDTASMTLLLRADGPEGSVQRQAERLLELASEGSSGSTILDDESTSHTWTAVNRALSSRPMNQEINVRVGVAPSGISDVIKQLVEISAEQSLPRAITADLGSGQVLARLTSADGGNESLSAAWSSISGFGQHATLLSAPIEVKRSTDVFGPQPAGFAVMRALKEQFDPAGTLNRGRFIGHL